MDDVQIGHRYRAFWELLNCFFKPFLVMSMQCWYKWAVKCICYSCPLSLLLKKYNLLGKPKHEKRRRMDVETQLLLIFWRVLMASSNTSSCRGLSNKDERQKVFYWLIGVGFLYTHPPSGDYANSLCPFSSHHHLNRLLNASKNTLLHSPVYLFFLLFASIVRKLQTSKAPSNKFLICLVLSGRYVNMLFFESNASATTAVQI